MSTEQSAARVSAICARCGFITFNFGCVDGTVVCSICLDEHKAPSSPLPAPSLTRSATLEAARDVTASREAHHGDPRDTFVRIAEMWTAILGTVVEAHHVALCMGALKIIRAAQDPKRGDNWVDLAGYAACGAEVAGAKP